MFDNMEYLDYDLDDDSKDYLHYVYGDMDGHILLSASDIKAGDVVAFQWENGRGVAVMATATWFDVAYNLFRRWDEDGGVWTSDQMPDGIRLYAPMEDDLRVAIDKLMTTDDFPQLYNQLRSSITQNMDPYINDLLSRATGLIRKEGTLQEQITKRLCRKKDHEIDKLNEQIGSLELDDARYR